MKTLNFVTIFFLGLVLILTGCEKDETNNDVGKDVELYLIESFKTKDTQYQIDENTVVTKAIPLLYYSDFISYDSQQYIFEISDESIKRINKLEQTISGIPFALKVNDEIIYTGYFWYTYSSQLCDGIIIWPEFIDVNGGIIVEYSNLISDVPDNRNANEILDVFRQDNKLIE